MKLVDSHCHLDRLDLSAYQGQLELALSAAKEQGVEHILCVAIDLNNVADVIKIAETYTYISASIGLHPTEIIEQEPRVEDLITLAQHPRVIAIGETGLDYYRDNGDMSRQQQRFRRHIRAAKVVDKPLIIHTRAAKEDTLQILQEEQANSIGGVLHCFTESLEMAVAAIEMNFYISFSGIITFANAKELQEVARALPLDRILIETDAPYLAPVPNRGKPNQPAYVRYVAEQLAKLRGISLEQVAEQTTKNFYNLFGLSQD